MKKTKKFAALILMLAVAMTCMFVGCGSNSNSSSNNSSKAANSTADDSFTKVKSNGTVVIGVDDEFPPMGFKDAKGNIVGFDVDFAKATCEKLGLKCEIKKIDWDSKEMELSTGKIDMIWNGYTITSEREKQVLFSKPYLASNQVILVANNSTIKSKKDLAGKKVGIQNGSSSEDALKADKATYNSIGDSNIKKYQTNVESFLDLKIGRVDAVVVDEVVARYQATKNPGQYKVLNDSFDKEEYGVGFRKNDKALHDKVQDAMNQVIKEGTAAKISNQWFGKDIVEK